jgi:phosphatidate cytidylyltransferase
MKHIRYGELGKRVGVAAITIPVIFGVILWGRAAFLVLVDIILVMALWEFYGLAEEKGFSPIKFLGILSVLVISSTLYFYHGRWMTELLITILFAILIIELFRGKAGAVANAAITLFGILYISLLSSLILIRELPVRSGLNYRVGGWLVILIFSTIWICDTVAYLYGARFGTHSLFKRVSPNKTWEGAIAGFIAGIIAAVGLHYVFVPSLSTIDSMVIGVIVGILGQISDLIESLYKRDAGVKDSSNILPGHGGFLDRFDSPILISPCVYVYLLLIGF